MRALSCMKEQRHNVQDTDFRVQTGIQSIFTSFLEHQYSLSCYNNRHKLYQQEEAGKA